MGLYIGVDISSSRELARYLNPGKHVSRKEHLRRLEELWEVLYWQAFEARKLASSHREFAVGCAVLGFSQDRWYGPRWRVFKGANAKILPESRTVCAEAIALGAALQAGCAEIIGMVVVGEPQEDSYSKKVFPTLHPCHECRVLMSSHPLMKGRARILTAVPADPPATFRIHTLRQILAIHGE